MITIPQYRQKLLEEDGYVDEDKVKAYAKERHAYLGNRKPFSVGVSRRHCRRGDRECNDYKGCCDVCLVTNRKVTSLRKCPLTLDSER